MSQTNVDHELLTLVEQLRLERRTGSDVALMALEERLTQGIDDAQARALIGAELVAYIDADRFRRSATTAIWVLGKLHDPSYVPFLSTLAADYVQRPLTGDLEKWLLWQTAIALDNLDLLPSFASVADNEQPATLRRILGDFLAGRGGHGSADS